MQAAALILCLVGQVMGQGVMPVPPDDGPCPYVPIVWNFDLHRYLGRWYEIERFFSGFQDGDCVTADYKLFPNDTVSVLNTDYTEGEMNSIQGIATLPDPNLGQLSVKFPFGGSKMDKDGPNYNVVATDYKNYAVVYSCNTFGPDFKLEFAWILGRWTTLPPKFLVELKEWLKTVNINSDRFMPTIQTDCPRTPF